MKLQFWMPTILAPLLAAGPSLSGQSPQEAGKRAQARPAALAAGPTAVSQGVSVRLIWDNATNDFGRVSSDGRWMSFVDGPSGSNIGLRDLRSGASRTVLKVAGLPASDVSVSSTSLSSDGRQIAYTARNSGTHEIHVVGADGLNDRTIYKCQPKEYVQPGAWLTDNRRLAVMRWGDGQQVKSGLLFLNAADGKVTLRVQTVYAWPSFSPDGKWFAYSSPREDRRQAIYIGALEGTDPPREFPAHLAGEGVLGWSPDGRFLLVQSLRDGSWGFWLRPVADGRISGQAEPVKVSLPHPTSGLGFLASGAFAHSLFEDRVTTLTAGFDLDRFAVSGPLQPFRAERGDSFGARWSPDGRKLFYRVGDRFVIHETATGEQYDVTPRVNRRGLWADWTPSGNEIILFGEEQIKDTGWYLVDPRTGDCRLLAKARVDRNNARAAFSRDGRTLYYNDNGIAAKDLASGEVRKLYPDAGARSLTVSPDGRLVAISLGRTIQLVDIRSGAVARTISTPKADDIFGQLEWLSDGSAILAELWNGGRWLNSSLVRIPLNGGAWAVTSLGTGTRGFALSPDGKSLAVTQLKNTTQVWLLENFLPPAR
jgi:Tol biopolymer transport system component